MKLGSNVWNPTTESSLRYWLAHNTGITGSETVEHWTNNSVAGGRWSQATEASQPSISEVEGSKRGLTFDGDDDYLSGNQFTFTSAFTIGIRFIIGDANATNDVIAGDITSASNFIRLNNQNTLGIKTSSTQKTIVTDEASPFGADAETVLVVERSAANLVRVWIDGTLQSNTNTCAGDFLVDAMGARYSPLNFFDGTVFEMCMFDRQHDEISENLSGHLMALKID